jgi:phosphatidylethanolamine N-methyltransferase
LKIGRNKSTLVTNISSRGLWVPVHDEEWDGDVPSGIDGTKMSSSSHEIDSGVVTFKGDTLPLAVGTYEVRAFG